MKAKDWAEVESPVYRPARWLPFVLGSVFLLTGIAGFLMIGGAAAPGAQQWIGRSMMAAFALVGALALAAAFANFVPVRVRHAAPDILRDVPREPVICEGSLVRGRLTHKLVRDADAWLFRPAENILRNDLRFLVGFGVPFMATCAGIASWVAHDDLHVGGWPLAVVCGNLAAVVFVVPALFLIGMLMRGGYRQLCRLSIPLSGGDLELDSPEPPDPDKMDLLSGLKWVFQTEAKRHRLTIARELVSAVQVCPWKYVISGQDGTEVTWAVQGLLVLSSAGEAGYYRLPILLTNDFVGASRLMQRLADTLHVPYLYCADAAGWKAESLRAKTRQPLRSGGIGT